MQSISLHEAEQLVQSGEWVYGSVAIESIMLEASRKVRSIVGTDLGRSRADIPLLNNTLAEVQEFLRERLESYEIEEHHQFQRLEVRVGERSVYKIGPTLNEGLFKILGIILAVVGTSNLLGPVGLVTVGLAAREFINAIVTGWEALDDPHEIAVFEALFSLHGKLSVVNGNAYEREDYAAAFGFLWPTEAEVVSYCKGLSSDETQRAFSAMKRRKIVTAKRGRWSIRF